MGLPKSLFSSEVVELVFGGIPSTWLYGAPGMPPRHPRSAPASHERGDMHHMVFARQRRYQQQKQQPSANAQFLVRSDPLCRMACSPTRKAN